ncbi:hypothetical protein SOVF_070260 [Spinacia oleracea]|nr:hypothetical protein SOVF_070260 [Spinacia oleracea]
MNREKARKTGEIGKEKPMEAGVGAIEGPIPDIIEGPILEGAIPIPIPISISPFTAIATAATTNNITKLDNLEAIVFVFVTKT